MNILIPIIYCKVEYQVVEGRPYSTFERTVLEAISEGHENLHELVELLGVNRSIVVQGVVTLIQAGWVALRIGMNSSYLLTDAGRVALSVDDKLPTTTRILPDKHAFVVRERIWGNICRSSTKRFVGRKEFKDFKGPCVLLAPVSSALPEPAEVRGLLEPAEGQRILSVGPILRQRLGDDWFRVWVDTTRQKIVGLPRGWERDTRLRCDILEAAISANDDLNREDSSEQSMLDEFVTQAAYEPDSQIERKLRVSRSQIYFTHGNEAHSRLFTDTLNQAQRGRDCIVIHSETLTVEGVRRNASTLQRALALGANIDILWGTRDSDISGKSHDQAFQMLLELEQISCSEVPGRLMLARSPSNLRCNLLLSNTRGRFEFTLGSQHWLGNVNAITFSVSSTSPSFVAELCSVCTDLLNSDDNTKKSYNTRRLEFAYSMLKYSVFEIEADSLDVEIIHDGRAIGAFCELINNTTMFGITIVTPRLPEFISPQLFINLKSSRKKGDEVRIITSSTDFMSSWMESGADRGVLVECRPDILANLAIGQDQFILGGFDVLSYNSRSTIGQRQRELGVCIQGVGIVQILEEKLKKQKQGDATRDYK